MFGLELVVIIIKRHFRIVGRNMTNLERWIKSKTRTRKLGLFLLLPAHFVLPDLPF